MSQSFRCDIPGLEFLSVLVVSDQHLDGNDAINLSEDAQVILTNDRSVADVSCSPGIYWVRATKDKETLTALARRYSGNLVRALEFANTNGFHYVRFDPTGPELNFPEHPTES